MNMGIPTHVALIMDGNGRWARARGLPRSEGHRRGAMVVGDILRVARDIGIGYVTLYAFSTENFSRPAAEVTFLMGLFEKFLRKHRGAFVKNSVRFRAIGDLEKLPKSLRTTVEKLVETTAACGAFNVTVALNYGARGEIVQAVKAIVADGRISADCLCWDVVRQHLDTADLPDPDLIIRTSGEQRLSNFLLLQSAYAELYFTKTHWPDFDGKCFLAAIDDYKHRKRRMGNVDDKASI
jgi:undecaprenyl diphosphate synthase